MLWGGEGLVAQGAGLGLPQPCNGRHQATEFSHVRKVVPLVNVRQRSKCLQIQGLLVTKAVGTRSVGAEQAEVMRLRFMQPDLQPGPRFRRTEEGRRGRSRSSRSERWPQLLCDVAFWGLLGVDVFGACYWVASQIAVLLIASHWLRADGALVFALTAGALLTPGVLAGLVAVFRRKR